MVSLQVRMVLAVLVGFVVWFAIGHFYSAPEWEVSPEQIAAAKAAGKPGYESSPGTVTVLPIRSETADVDKLIATLGGVGVALVTLGATRPRLSKPRG